MQLIDLIKGLQRYRWVIISLVALALIASSLYVQLRPQRYQYSQLVEIGYAIDAGEKKPFDTTEAAKARIKAGFKGLLSKQRNKKGSRLTQTALGTIQVLPQGDYYLDIELQNVAIKDAKTVRGLISDVIKPMQQEESRYIRAQKQSLEDSIRYEEKQLNASNELKKQTIHLIHQIKNKNGLYEASALMSLIANNLTTTNLGQLHDELHQMKVQINSLTPTSLRGPTNVEKQSHRLSGWHIIVITSLLSFMASLLVCSFLVIINDSANATQATKH